MDEHEIIMRAQRDVAERRAARSINRWSGPWSWLLPTLASAVVAGFLFAPGELPLKLLLAMGGVCGLRPSHSYFAGAMQLPLEARMTGIYAGFTITFAILVLRGRLRARHLGGRWTIALLGLLFGAMAFDGVNSTLFEVGRPFLYTPNNLLRLFTGLASGIAIAAGLAWLWGLMVAPRADAPPRAVVASVGEIAVLMVLNTAFGMLVLSERAIVYYPIALLSVIGILSVITIAILLVVLRLSRLEGHVASYRHLLAPGALALLIAMAVLAATAAVRWSSAQS